MVVGEVYCELDTPGMMNDMVGTQKITENTDANRPTFEAADRQILDKKRTVDTDFWVTYLPKTET